MFNKNINRLVGLKNRNQNLPVFFLTQNQGKVVKNSGKWNFLDIEEVKIHEYILGESDIHIKKYAKPMDVVMDVFPCLDNPCEEEIQILYEDLEWQRAIIVYMFS